MSTSELDRVRAAAQGLLASDLFQAARVLPDRGEDAHAVVGLLAEVLLASAHHGRDEVPIDQALRAGVTAERLRRRGVGLDTLVELALAVQEAARQTLPSDLDLTRSGRALILTLVRTYLDAEIADHQEQNRELRALISISRSVHRTLDPMAVAEAGLQETVAAMRLDAGGIWLAQGIRTNLVLSHSVGLPQNVIEEIDSIDMAAAGHITETIRAGSSIEVDVAAENPVLSAYRSALLVPLRAGFEQIGLLAVGSHRIRKFSESEVAFVTAVADHLAAALDHAFEHRREAHTDYLTGLANRSEFESTVRRELAAVVRHRRPLTLMLMDLDLLKKINDRLGHHTGDEAIRTIGQVIRKAVRTSDLSARLGGDEFAVLMPETDLAQASEVMARVQESLRERVIAGLPPLELSFGLAEWQSGFDYAALFNLADQNLYRDKRRHQARRARRAKRVATARLGASKPSSTPISSPATPSTWRGASSARS